MSNAGALNYNYEDESNYSELTLPYGLFGIAIVMIKFSSEATRHF